MNVHEQTLVKVNAQVDKGIAPLVEAISQYPEVATVSSCEGEKGQDAYVAFVVACTSDAQLRYSRKQRAK